MADDSQASGSSPTAQATGRDTFSGPALRRAATINFGTQPQPPHSSHAQHVQSASGVFGGFGRRGSGFSDGFSDARKDLENSADELFNPTRAKPQESAERSALSYTPLALALLPALAGMLFQNGAAFFTDLILLCIAAVVLNWSVTQPWDWYHAAQQIRIANAEPRNEPVFESDSDLEMSTTSATTALENAPEQSDTASEPRQDGSPKAKVVGKEEKSKLQSQEGILRAARRDAAARELFMHEMAALVWCFLFPLISTYMLHAIRKQLTRPSEGLVSDYNLTIFLCAAEFRPVKHMLKMVHDRTLRVQRVVAQNQHETEKPITPDQVQELFDRINDLESHAAASTNASGASHSTANGSARRGELSPQVTQAVVARELNKTMVPELEALNRAMRRYEKKLALLASQTDNRLEYIDFRLQDAIALAAVAAKNSKNNSGSLWSWLVERVFAIVMFPFHAMMAVLTFPVRTMSTIFTQRKALPSSANGRRSRPNHQGRSNSDRVPSRLSRR